MKKMPIKRLPLITALCTTISIAQADQFTLKTVEVKAICPTPDKLIKNKNKMMFYAGDNWRTYEKSFITKVTTFVGAQWDGINVGRIICVYIGKPKGSFPLQLHFMKLSKTPDGGKWKQKNSSLKSCASTDRTQCPFTYTKKTGKIDIYEEAAAIKKDSTNDETGF